MAPTNPPEEQRSGNRPRGNLNCFDRRIEEAINNFNRRSYHYQSFNEFMRTNHTCNRSENINQEYDNHNNIAQKAGNSHYGDEPRPIRNKKDRGGGRGSGARRKENGNKNNSKSTTDNVKRDRVYSECSDEHCPICLNRMKIYAVGMCNHPVCSECSTRMRILCGQNECPICRQDMPKVIHTTTKQKYEDIQNNIYIMDRKYKICFEDEAVQHSYKVLLEHTCPICDEKSSYDENHGASERKHMKYPKTFSSFKQLDTHVRREHELFYCDLCVDHLKIFSHERKLYTRSDLATHRRKGDENDSSHKGHPLCEFCQARWVDSDALFRHLRRDHFFCHFCDADGKQVYYDSYDKGLREHFKQEHYLCEEGDCVNEQFTTAFRDEIDLKAHMTERHSSNLSKAAAKQIRTVDLDFTYARPTNSQAGRRRGRDFEESVPSHGVGVSVIPNSMNNASSLVDQVDGPVSSRQPGNAAPVMTTENFPTLGGNKLKNNSQPGHSQGNLAQRVAISSGRTVKSNKGNGGAGGRWAGSNHLSASGMLDEEFPSLTGGIASNTNDKVSQKSIDYTNIKQKGNKKSEKQPKSSEEQFPSLWSANSNMSNFREAQTTPAYRNIAGYQPAWSSSNNPINDKIPETSKPTQQAADSSSGMVTLSKKSGKNPAPMPSGIDDFPDLEVPAKAIVNDATKNPQPNGTIQKKKKNKSKKGGFVGDDLVSVRQNSSRNKNPKEETNLASAADLISLDSSKDVKKSPTKSKTVKSPETGDVSISSFKIQNTLSDKKPKTHENKLPFENGIVGKSNDEVKDNFPALGASSNKISAHFVRKDAALNDAKGAWKDSKENLPPEKSVQDTSSNKSRPPPGFLVSKPFQTPESVPVPPPGFQGNRSDHQVKGEVKEYQKQSDVYIPPKNFSSRNNELLKLITNAMGGLKSEKFQAFKTLSSQFRSGAVSCDNYHKQCLELVDATTFELFFPELLCLLPDIQKQQELYAIHLSKFSKNIHSVLPCSTCAQIVAKREQKDHMREHLVDQDFPQLA